MAIEQVTKNEVVNGLLPLAGFAVRFPDIAERFNLSPESWWEDGLGPAVGAFCRFSSGRVVLIYELEHLVKRHSSGFMDVMADVGDIVSLGVTALVDEAIAELNISREHLIWSTTAESEQLAARMLHGRKPRPSL